MNYLDLGIRHIIFGADHLLFLLGLILIVKDRWMLLESMLAFTVAHGWTLAAASLGYTHAPVPPLDTALALSILFLGSEIVRRRRGATSFVIRNPWALAFAFGLLHSLGAVGSFSAMGLPAEEITFALLTFYAGVEFAQLSLVALFEWLARFLRGLEVPWPRWLSAAPAYAVGGLGAYWTIQRTFTIFD